MVFNESTLINYFIRVHLPIIYEKNLHWNGISHYVKPIVQYIVDCLLVYSTKSWMHVFPQCDNYLWTIGKTTAFYSSPWKSNNARSQQCGAQGLSPKWLITWLPRKISIIWQLESFWKQYTSMTKILNSGQNNSFIMSQLPVSLLKK